MKRKLLKIFALSCAIATIGLVLDGDPVEPSMMMRFVELFAMIASVFTLISIIYFSASFILKSIQKDKIEIN